MTKGRVAFLVFRLCFVGGLLSSVYGGHLRAYARRDLDIAAADGKPPPPKAERELMVGTVTALLGIGGLGTAIVAAVVTAVASSGRKRRPRGFDVGHDSPIDKTLRGT